MATDVTHSAASATGTGGAKQSRPARALARVADSPRLQVALAALAYLAYALVVTWPTVTELGSALFGSGGDDNWSLLAYMRELRQQGTDPFTPGTLHDLAAPEGMNVSYGLALSEWPSLGLLWLLSLAIGQVAALNVFVLIGYVANGTAMMLLVRRITGSGGAGFVVGFAFAFMPFMIVKGQIHQYFMHGWVFVLLAWRLVELSQKPTPRNAVLLGLAAIFAVSWNPYFILFGFVLIAAFAVVDLIGALRRRQLFRYAGLYLLSGGMVVATLGIYASLAFTQEGAALLSRPISEAYVYTLRPHELLLPDARNVLLGDLVAPLRFEHLHGSGYGETAAYVGWSVLLLAAVATLAALRKRLDERIRPLVWRFLAIATAATAMAAPPTTQVGSVTVYLPTWFVYQFTATWRVFARIVVVIELGLCVTAGIGLAYLLRSRTGVARAVALAVVTVIVALDLSARPIGGATPIPHPPIYDVLARQPGPGLVADYPLLPNRIPIYEPILFQDLYDKPVINGYGEGTDGEARALQLAALDDPRTAPRLALLGVRWIVVDERAPSRPDYAAPATPGKGFHLIDREDARALYAVTARPARTWVTAGRGFWSPEGTSEHPFSWTSTASSRILLRGNCRATCDGTLRFGSTSFDRPRRVRVLAADGRVLAERKVGSVNTAFEVPVRFRGATSVTVEATPGPQSVRATTGAPDDRSLGVTVADPRLELDAP